jgi:hypothetical protein
LEKDTTKQGKLFLIPISIEQEFNNDFLLEEDKKKLKKIKNFIVENPKTARKALKKLNLDQNSKILILLSIAKNPH